MAGVRGRGILTGQIGGQHGVGTATLEDRPPIRGIREMDMKERNRGHPRDQPGQDEQTSQWEALNRRPTVRMSTWCARRVIAVAVTRHLPGSRTEATDPWPRDSVSHRAPMSATRKSHLRSGAVTAAFITVAQEGHQALFPIRAIYLGICWNKTWCAESLNARNNHKKEMRVFAVLGPFVPQPGRHREGKSNRCGIQRNSTRST